MRVLQEFQQHVGDHIINSDKSIDRVMYDVERAIEKFKQKWPGDYELYANLESYHSLVIGVRFKTAQDYTWHKIRWS